MPLKKVVAVAILMLSFNAFCSGNVFIDGKKVKNNEDLQILLRKQLNLPPHFDKGLNDIYEGLLADLKSDHIVRIKNVSFLKKKLGEQYVNDLIGLVGLASEGNAHVVLILE